jgi:hypothetical protein
MGLKHVLNVLIVNIIILKNRFTYTETYFHKKFESTGSQNRYQIALFSEEFNRKQANLIGV